MKIKLVERKNPLKRDDAGLLYPSAVSAGKKTLRQVASEIAARSSLTKGDIESVLSNFAEYIPQVLADGFSVQLGEFGTMRLSLSGDGAASEKEFRVDSISAKVIFTPSVGFKETLKNIRYERTE